MYPFYLEAHKERHTQRIKLYIAPYFKNITLDRISRLYLVEFVKNVQGVACAETASKSLNLVKQVLDYAVLCGYIELNPSLGLSAIIKKPKARPMPAFTKEADIRRLMCALDVYPHEVVKCLMLFTIYTLGRPSECRLAKWGEIEGDLWTVPSERMKMRKEHIVPLSRQAQEILENMRKYKQSEFIFPSLRGGRALSDNALLVALRTMGFSKDEICVHGFRSMGSTVLNEKGYRHDVIEKALAHAGEDKIRAIYNRAEYLEERRQMLQGYSDWLEGLL